ncbi:MAG: methylated-DNA--[protein]-cysteine S-methyltransferase [Acidobacteria bacterium]|nr:MAG: methylated-DNA--[protein]-cysteine S-methyltransferase [Acidobacteriota bacterium]REK04252.1 MAG: methylated-DNA--[protein]-cysteine S-methyltransferase [Acidobacteriota bacterium]
MKTPRSSAPTVWRRLHTPIGELRLVGSGDVLHRILLPESRHEWQLPSDCREDPKAFAEAARQLGEYFAGTRRSFDLALAPVGTDFQLDVWQQLRRIPYGETISYAELAARTGNPNASRAVGAANGRNPLPIVVPCHRVIGADGSLVGFGGGLDAKRSLLRLEGAEATREAPEQRRLLAG